MTAQEIATTFHLKSFFIDAQQKISDPFIQRVISTLKKINLEASIEARYHLGQLMERKEVQPLLQSYYNTAYPDQFTVTPRADIPNTHFGNEFDGGADIAMGDLFFLEKILDISSWIDVKGAQEKERYGSIKPDSVLSFGNKDINSGLLARLKKEYNYDHLLTLENHCYLVTNIYLSKAILVKATAIYGHLNELTANLEANYITAKTHYDKQCQKTIPGFLDLLTENIDYVILK